MDTIKSFKGYGKVDSIEEQSFQRKTRRRIIIVSVSCVVLLVVIVAAVAGTLINKRDNSSPANTKSPATPYTAIKSVCSVTRYPESCISSLQKLNSSSTDPEDIFKMSLNVALSELETIPSKLVSKYNDVDVRSALAVCDNVIQDGIEYLQDSISSVDVKSGEKMISTGKIDDLRTWLSSVLTDQETCLDAIRDVNSKLSQTVLEEVTGIMKNSAEFSSNSLAIATKLLRIMSDIKLPVHRKLLEDTNEAFPSWVRAADRKLLQKTTSVVPNVTVASDGSGDVLTINAALEKVPIKSKTRFVIYIKAGTYLEYVELNKTIHNVMMYGEGMGKTIISGDKNFGAQRIPTFSTATFIVAGKGFIAKDIGFKNTAVAAKHQAVALRSNSDLSVFYRCSFDAYQDTLYPHSNRQFYRECDITGTIDFIFGNAAVVFQRCNILPRQPLPNQFVTITAQGKKDPSQNTGISIDRCTIVPLDNLKAPTYLGRPWKDFSTTVIMQSSIGSFLHKEGWISWINNQDPPSTILYGEYENSGLGAGVDARVKWAGYKPTITPSEASKFSVVSFIEGHVWLPETGVTFE